MTASNKDYRKYPDYLVSYIDGSLCNGSGSKDSDMSILMKAITSHASHSIHFESPEIEEGRLSPEANNSDDNDNETEDYLQVNSDLPKLNQMYSSHSSCQTQCA